jgi:hypothetical protein
MLKYAFYINVMVLQLLVGHNSANTGIPYVALGQIHSSVAPLWMDSRALVGNLTWDWTKEQ